MERYRKEFDKWNDKKKLRDESTIPYDFYFHERDVWWCAVGVNVGAEVDGKHDDFERPILVVKKFNRDMFWGIPLTKKAKDHPAFVLLHHERGPSYANTSQLRTWSTKRLLRRIGMVSHDEFQAVCEKITEVITIEPHR
jgi:mRNA interferase MazF